MCLQKYLLNSEFFFCKAGCRTKSKKLNLLQLGRMVGFGRIEIKKPPLGFELGSPSPSPSMIIVMPVVLVIFFTIE